jgi:hypothetical protein
MMRLSVVTAFLVMAAGPASAQPPPSPVRLTVEPMAAPVPALKYYLMPQVRDRERGNAAFLYYRAFSPEWQSHRRDPKYLDRVATANEKPLRELKRAEIDALAKQFSSPMLREVDRAARRTYCDWELNQRVREEGIYLPFPDVQGFRTVASLLHLRARQEMLAGRYDQAARTIQTGLGLGRHVAEGPTLIHTLVGVACVSNLLPAIEDWIERPGAPNLYWALTDLPRPLLSVRNGLEGERFYIDWLFPGYRARLEDPGAASSPARVQSSLQKYAGLMDLDGAARTWKPLVIALKVYPRAKRFLRQSGRSAEEVEAIPALQAVFLYEIHHYDVAYDDLRKWANLPYHEAAPYLRRALDRARAQSKEEGYSTLASVLLPSLDRVLAAPVRVERKIAALRCVEALRLYAAAHSGKLPAKLDEVKDVSIPLDPRTGKPFEYRLEGNRATLTGPAPEGDRADVNNFIRYELTMRTSKGK